MVSPSSMRSSAPSATLLRFLKSQSDGLCFFAPNVKSRPQCYSIYNSAAEKQSWASGSHKIGNLGRCTPTRPREATLEASFLPTFGRSSKKPRQQLAAGIHGSHGTSNISASSSPVHSFGTSSKKEKGFLRRLVGLQRQPPQPKLRPDDLPASLSPTEEGNEGNMFSVGRLAAKASNEPRLRCTELDGGGNVTLVNGEFKKSELIAKYGLLPRDLRKIDSSVLPHILVRHSAILISLLHLRVLIKADRVLVFDAYGSADSYIQSLFMYDLEGKLRQTEPSGRQAPSQGALPYEFRALEAVLVSVTSGLEGEFEGVREPVVRVLRALEEDIDRDKLRHLLVYSKRLGSFEQKARLVRDAIEDLLEADDDLTAMYLTEKSNGTSREEHDHQEVEMLLESYHKVCDEIVQASSNLVTSIRNTEEVVKAILDANRNSLMLLELKFSIGTLGLAAGTLASALYGMNLKNYIEESDFGFAAVSGTCFLFTAIVCTYGLLKLRKVQRVRMWGEGGIQDRYCSGVSNSGIPSVSKGNWRSESLSPEMNAHPGDRRPDRMRRTRNGATPPPVPSVAAVAAARKASRLSKSSASTSARQGHNKGVVEEKSDSEQGGGQQGPSSLSEDGGVAFSSTR